MFEKKVVFLKRIILTAIFIFTAMFCVLAQQQMADEWSITDYFKNLPEKYITATGDFPKPTARNITVDEKNGYAAAFTDFPIEAGSLDAATPVFQMALFKSQTKPPLIVISNRISDSVCDEYETFFLRRVGNRWLDVKREVLPPINLKMFWDAPQSVERLLKITKESFVSYHFDLPRRGTQVKASLEICDYLEEDAPETANDEMITLRDSAKTLYLEWDKQNGKFKFAK